MIALDGEVLRVLEPSRPRTFGGMTERREHVGHVKRDGDNFTLYCSTGVPIFIEYRAEYHNRGGIYKERLV